MSDSISSLGGKARAAALTGDERSQIAQQAANARWNRSGQTLTIPLDVGEVKIPFPMSEEDFSLLLDTLHLWKRTLVKKPESVNNPVEKI